MNKRVVFSVVAGALKTIGTIASYVFLFWIFVYTPFDTYAPRGIVSPTVEHLLVVSFALVVIAYGFFVKATWHIVADSVESFLDRVIGR